MQSPLAFLRRLAAEPPFRLFTQLLLSWLPCSVETRAWWDLSPRPQFLVGLLFAARRARAEGVAAICAIEFGVAGGNGLLALERAASAAAELLGVDAEVFGFDTGTGMPPPVDHRDVPWTIPEGVFELDEPALRARLTTAELVLGPVAQTVPEWLRSERAPLAFAAFDLDYYSATADALTVFDAPARRLLPRVVCYFDDLFGLGWSDFAGERAAIADFNAAHEQRKVGKVHGLRYDLPDEQLPLPWHEQVYLAHLFDHPDYCKRVVELGEEWLDAHRLPPEA
jgi:hypothetical protein